MTMYPGRSFDPIEVIGAVLAWPPTCFVLAGVVAATFLVVTTGRGQRAPVASGSMELVRVRYRAERLAVRVVAFLIAIAWLVEFVLRGYVLDMSTPWWRFTIPLAFAVVGLGIVLGIVVTSGSHSPEGASAVYGRRTWVSFTPNRLLAVAAIAVGVLVATTVAAGLASTPNGEGEYAWLAIPIPNEVGIDPLRVPFYGWTYGVPVLIGLAALLPVTWAAFDRNAARPFLHPDTAPAERDARRTTARAIVLILTAGTLLSLAGAWRLVASGGSSQYLTITGQNGDLPYDAAWRYGEFAVIAGWSAPVVDVIALSILFVMGGRNLLPRPTRSRTPAAGIAPTSAGVAQ